MAAPVNFAHKRALRAFLREAGASPDDLVRAHEREAAALLAERTAEVATILRERGEQAAAVVDRFVGRAEAINITAVLEREATHLEGSLVAIKGETAALRADVAPAKDLLAESRHILASLKDVLAELAKKAKSPPENPHLLTLRRFGEAGAHYAASKGRK